MSEWAPVVQTILWIAFLSVILIVGRGKFSAIAEAFRARIASGAAFKATGPAGLSVELSEQNAVLTPVAPADTVREDGGAAAQPDWTLQRKQIAATQRGVHIAHTVAPSTKPGQKFDIYVYLVGWRRDRFGLPNDLADVDFAEFYMGPAWGDKVIRVERRKGRIGFRTASHAPALCICRVTFKDGDSVVMSRYLDFEMGEAIAATD